jgi:hypothetical protein
VGNQKRLKRSRHELRTATRAAMLEHDAATQARPDVQAAQAAQAADEGLQKILKHDLPDQKARLALAGWRQRAQACDGLGTWEHRGQRLRLLHSACRETDGLVWGHVSLSAADGHLPGWYPLRNASWLVYPGRTGLVVVAPEAGHVNITETAHIWTCLEGDVLPDFGRFGTI